ncbi:MAG: T9SS type A sorting domain-containing protein [Bacteroidota bacterium]
MKKVYLLVASLVLSGLFLSGQNLVPNCSFEDTMCCPDGLLGEIHCASSWGSCNVGHSSPDYFFNCGGYTMVPQRYTSAFQNPATGNAYAAIIPWMNRFFNTIYDTREFITIKLKSPLIVGQQYYVAFKMNLRQPNPECSFASSKTGLLLSTMADITYPPPVNNFAHIYSDTVITDTVNWTTVAGWLIADSSYEYICIGNFFDDAHTDILRTQNITGAWDTCSWYFIDDVCVSIDSAKCSCDITNSTDNLEKIQIRIYPNPASDYFILRLGTAYQNFSLALYDTYGNEIKRIESSTEYQNVISTKNLPKGIYFLKIVSAGNHFFEKLIINY